MPYKSKKQAAYMHIHHPEIAKRWDKEYGSSPVAEKDSPRKKALRKKATNGN